MAIDNLLEKQFLIGNVMQVAVLTHAEAFQENSIEQYADLLQQVTEFAEETLKPLHVRGDETDRNRQGESSDQLDGYAEAWEKLVSAGWQNIYRHRSPDGIPLPESVSIALQETITAADPSFGRVLAATMIVGNIMQGFGNSPFLKTGADALYRCEMRGVPALFEPGDTHHMEIPNTLARIRDDGSCSINGTKNRVFAGEPGLTENMMYLVTARVDGEKDGGEKMILVAVPRLIEVEGRLVENGLSLETDDAVMGLRSAGCSRIVFGKTSECRGFPLEIPDSDITHVQVVLEDWFSQGALQAISQTGVAARELSRYCEDPEAAAPRSRDALTARLAPVTMFLRSIDEGLRGALYMGAFFRDCEKHGADSQKIYFSDLASLYRELFRVYAPEKALEAVSKSIRQAGGQVFEDGNIMELIQRDLQASLLFGPDENKAAEVILYQFFPRENGRILQQLLKQFETVESYQVTSEILIETIGIWRDYVGGIIVLFDDIMAGLKDSKSLISPMFAAPIMRLFGDVILCFHLIRQGMEAERMLAEEEVNFYNLQQEVSSNPDLHVWYGKLLLAEYFAVHVLSMQESVIRLIQRDPQALLEPV